MVVRKEERREDGYDPSVRLFAFAFAVFLLPENVGKYGEGLGTTQQWNMKERFNVVNPNVPELYPHVPECTSKMGSLSRA